MKKLRLWLADKLIGKLHYMKNITFYQTVCLDINTIDNHLNNIRVELGHTIKWKGKEDGTGFYFDYYKESVEEQT